MSLWFSRRGRRRSERPHTAGMGLQPQGGSPERLGDMIGDELVLYRRIATLARPQFQ
jgi:hypothetical protein